MDNDEGEASSLASIPKPENDDVKKSIIRTTIKNENLLAKKMENSKIRKSNKKKTSALKHKVERSDKLTGVLATKIEQSIARAKYVQNARKSGWEQINKTITIKNDMAEEIKSASVEPEKTVEEIEKDAEDEYVRQFYGNDATNEEKDDVSVRPTSNNRFALLDEAEA